VTEPDLDIQAACNPEPGGWTCRVTVGGPGAPTTHDVTVRPDELVRLAPGATDPTDLVRRSFAFLLEREPRTSILRQFDLEVIGRYFPEWERTIRRSAPRAGL
jgi:hypothetical protein